MRVWSAGVFVVVLISGCAAWWENGFFDFGFLSPWLQDGTRTKDEASENENSAGEGPLTSAGDEDKDEPSMEQSRHSDHKLNDEDEEEIARKIEAGQIQTERIRGKIIEMTEEYNDGMVRVESKLDMCLLTEMKPRTSPSWWPTEETDDPSDEDSKPARTRRPRQRTTPPYYQLIGREYYNVNSRDEEYENYHSH